MTESETEYKKSICNKCKKEIWIPPEFWSDNPKDHYCFDCIEEF